MSPHSISSVPHANICVGGLLFAGGAVALAGLGYYFYSNSSTAQSKVHQAEGKAKGLLDQAEGKTKGLINQAEGKVS